MTTKNNINQRQSGISATVNKIASSVPENAYKVGAMASILAQGSVLASGGGYHPDRYMLVNWGVSVVGMLASSKLGAVRTSTGYLLNAAVSLYPVLYEVVTSNVMPLKQWPEVLLGVGVAALISAKSWPGERVARLESNLNSGKATEREVAELNQRKLSAYLRVLKSSGYDTENPKVIKAKASVAHLLKVESPTGWKS